MFVRNSEGLILAHTVWYGGGRQLSIGRTYKLLLCRSRKRLFPGPDYPSGGIGPLFPDDSNRTITTTVFLPEVYRRFRVISQMDFESSELLAGNHLEMRNLGRKEGVGEYDDCLRSVRTLNLLNGRRGY
ncbi:hypothetical protein Trydic_g1465 [Trypoxylus dichotomus]